MNDLEDLVNVVLKHMPLSNAAIEVPHFSIRAQIYAQLIFYTVDQGAEIHGLTESKSTPRDVIRDIRKLDSTLNGLSVPGRRILLAQSFVNQVESFSALDDFQVNMGKFLAGALKMNKHHNRPRASQKRDWKAAAAALICRQIWADEEILNNGARWQRFCANRLSKNEDLESVKGSFRKQFAPKSQKADAPGPFGRFLEDVIVSLDISSKVDGTHVSAASALRSLKDHMELR